jgi:hypothetical protein
VGTADNPIDPVLGPLQDNGGPTRTMAPLVGSPALDAGDNTDAPPTDQRGAPRIAQGTIDIGAYEVQAAPTVGCAVARSLLWPPNRRLVNVGFGVQLNEDADPSVRVRVQVFGNDLADSSDAADIGPGTLRLRSERRPEGLGFQRVYLLVVTATDASGQTSFDVCTVVVPRALTADALFEVRSRARWAEVWYRQYQTVTADFSLLGEGPAGGVVTASSPWARPGAAVVTGEVFRPYPEALTALWNFPGRFPNPRTPPAGAPADRVLSGREAAPGGGRGKRRRDRLSLGPPPGDPRSSEHLCFTYRPGP